MKRVRVENEEDYNEEWFKSRGSGVKRSARERGVSPVSRRFSTSISSSDESDTLCSIWYKKELEPVTKRKLGKNQSVWV
ncbi:hypothetical protein LOD99_10249 [Oopsacas minuta]|uniref:Uncharacterized protein n=1 Tax=Oopsacas minuta TaxID=111878 RepID=A0AAV7KHE4_9METZ|nr:hypothetical protein LOD99_10249 [Oopsacas minuta]